MTEQAARAQLEPGWTDPAVTRDGNPMVVITAPLAPPETLQHHQIQMDLEDGATVRDIAAVLSNLGYSVIVADKAAAAREILIPRYRGELGGLLRAVQKAGDVWITWEQGAIVISSLETVEVSLPQEQHLADRIAKGLVAYGYKQGEAPVSAEAGLVSLKVRPSTYVSVRNYLSRMTANAALVNMQVALINVQLHQDASQGWDWEKMQFALNGDHKTLLQTLSPQTGSSLGSTTGTTSGSTTGTSSSSTSDLSYVTPNASLITGTTNGGTPVTRTLPNTGAGYLLSGGALRGVISSGAFSLVGFVEYLETYGSTKTVQSVMLRTVTGRQVELKSVTEIPYVSNIGVGGYGSNYTNGSYGTGTLSGSGSGTSLGGFGDNGTSGTGSGTSTGATPSGSAYGGYNGLLGSASTATAQDGITLRLLPAYDEASQSVTVELSMSLQAVLSFQTLSAGNQIGSLSQPTTAQQTFNDTLRVRPGQTVVVGGLTYDSVKRSNAVPLFLPDKAGHSTLAVTRQAMFIVLRPTVTVLGALQDSGAQLFAPAAEERPGPAVSAH